jgi:DNA-directed RNA polymerase beta subunit
MVSDGLISGSGSGSRPRPRPRSSYESGIVKITLPGDASERLHLIIRNLNKLIYPTYAKYSHCELHASMWHGILSQMIPFPDRNQSPRNCYQSAMGKQAIGTYVSNYTSRTDTIANVLSYPQYPLVEPRTVKYTPLSELPHGFQAVVAIMLYSGYNQEDSIIANRGAIEAGMYNSIYYKTYTNKQQKHKTNGADDERYGVSVESRKKIAVSSYNKYHAVDLDTGIPKLGKYILPDDILISKYKKKIDIYNDISTVAKDRGIVDYIIPNDKVINENGEGYKFIKVRTSSLRKIVIGDKVASRSAQKGTVSMKFSRADMPFTSAGIYPEIIMNAHAIPSRMTIAQLSEAHLGKLAAISGKNRDATPFTKCDLRTAKEEMERYGYNHNGDEIMYNGQTGEMFNVAIFINPTYYQKLKHMVDDKMHCLTMDHEVCTIAGWKHFHDLTLADKIATRGPMGQVIYEHPKSLLKYEHNNYIYVITGPGISLKISQEHRLFIRADEDYALIEAHQFNIGMPLVKSKELCELYKEKYEHDNYANVMSQEWHTGNLFCLQVPNEVFYVRHNGHSCWTGNSRDLGPVQLLTRQPAEGRAREGGLRIGEMERDCFIAHGSALFLKEKMMESSDIFKVYHSEDTGDIISANPTLGIYKQGDTNIYETEEIDSLVLPFATKLLLDELKSMYIDTKIIT